MKKIMALVLAAMMLLACCSALAEAPEGYPEVKEGIDFGGADVTIYDYWSGEGARKTDPTEEEQLQYDYRDWINKTYNVNLSQKQDGDWGSNATQMTNFTTSPDGSLRLYIIEPGSVASLVSGGVVAPVSDKYVDLLPDYEVDNEGTSMIWRTTFGSTHSAQPQQYIWRNVVINKRNCRVLCIDRLLKDGKTFGYVYVLQGETKQVPNGFHWDVTDQRHMLNVAPILEEQTDLSIELLKTLQ